MPPDLDIHLVVDNCGTHKHAGVKRRLAARPRCHIHRFTDEYNPGARPFAWTATADSILRKTERLCLSVSGTRH